jgi:hypothetical protein
MPRKKLADIEAMHDRIGELLSHADDGTTQWHTLYGAYKAIQWVLGFSDHSAVTFEEVLTDTRRLEVKT